MKIALINPSFPPPYSLIIKLLRVKDSHSFPLGLGYIAAYVRRAGHAVKIFDPEPRGMAPESLWKEVKEFGPDIVGITSATPNFMTARQLAVEAKRRLGCLVIMGGPHVTALPRSTLESIPALDAVILGEGEIPMLAVAEEFDASGAVDFSKIPGAAFMEGGSYRETPLPGPISAMDSLPNPARDLAGPDLYYQHRYILPNIKSTTLISSRGCPSQCTFCANICMGRKFRPHSPGYVAGEIERLVKDFGIRHIKIYDDCFTTDPRRVSEICDLIIGKRLDITWEAAGRVNTLSDEALVLKMKKAGCVQVLLGIETGSQPILNLMKKGTTLAMAEQCCCVLRKCGLGYTNSFIIGNEGDTRETVTATIDFAEKLRSDRVTFTIMIPLPGTALFNKYFKDYDVPGTDWNNWCSQGLNRPYKPRHTILSMDELMELQRRAFGRFYNNPLYLLRSLISIKKF